MFNTIKRNAALAGSVIARFNLIEIRECQEECLLNEGCKSINFLDEGVGYCELSRNLAANKENDIKLVDREGWLFMSVDGSGALVSFYFAKF